jgi:7-carboxy-7-deazaguanine synthase
LMEHFYTIQGEGYNTGKACYFLRLGGCDVGCVWCDVKESWDVNEHPIVSTDEMVNYIKSVKAERTVITGGEPLMHDLTFLTEKLRENKIETMLETSGAYSLTGIWNWVCVSPKKFKSPLQEVLKEADELKVIVYNKSDFEWAEANAGLVKDSCKLFLQPEYDSFHKVTPMIIDYVKQNPKWRISLQTHKIINVP